MGIKALGAIAVLGLALANPVMHYATKETLTGAVITDKERITSGGDSKFMVWTEAETFENTDSLLAWKFNSSDVHGRLRVGATCDMTVNGFRVPFLSSYRNILAADCR